MKCRLCDAVCTRSPCPECEVAVGNLLDTTTPEYLRALAKNLNVWVPASGGHETPFLTRSGRNVLYCYNPAERRHAYIDLSTDIEMSQDDVNAAGLGGY